MWLEILAADRLKIMAAGAQGMQLTLVYGAQPGQALPSLCSAHPLMMADPLSLIEPLDKKGMLRGMAISSDTLRAAPPLGNENKWGGIGRTLGLASLGALLAPPNRTVPIKRAILEIVIRRCGPQGVVVVSSSDRATSVAATR